MTLPAFAPAAAQNSGFLDVKNENPLLRGLYLPMPIDSRSGEGASLAATWAIANTINVESRGGEQLFVDGEAMLLRFSVDVPLAPRWRMRLNLPLVRDSAGSLDSIIDRWHGWFGLPRGERPNYPRNRLTYSYSGPASLFLNRSHSGIGDTALEMGWYAIEDDSRTVAIWGGLEAPTGSAHDLTGNGGWDAGLWLHAGWKVRRWDLGGEAGLLRPFGDDLFGGLARRSAAFGRVAAGFAVAPAWTVRLQLEAQSARLKDTQLRFLGPSLLLSAGMEHRFGDRWNLQLGFAEDAAVNTAPDVTFFLRLRRGGGLH